MTSETPPRNPVVPPDRFASAVLSDLLRQYDPEEVDWWRSKGFTPCLDDNAQSSSPWKIVEEAVFACTRDLRDRGYYPEAVLAAVKSAMRQAAAPLVPAQAVTNLIRKAAQACIAAYFEPPNRFEAASERPPVSIPRGASTVGLQVWERREKNMDLLSTSLGDS